MLTLRRYTHIRLEDFKVRIFPYILIVFAVVVDSINGFMQDILHISTPIGQIFRFSVILYTAGFILKLTGNFKKLISATVFVYSLGLPIWLMNEPNFSMGTEISYFLKIFLYYCIASYFYVNKYNFDNKYLAHLINTASVVSALLIIFCGVTGLGKSTYTVGDLQIGSKGFFIAGNDVGLYMNICLIGTIVNLIFFNRFRQILIILFVYIGNLATTSRVGMIGSTLTVIVFFCFLVLKKTPPLKVKKLYLSITKVMFFLCISGIIIGGVTFISQNDYLIDKFSTDSSFNPRQLLLNAANESIDNMTGIQLLVGRSFPGSMITVGKAYNLSIYEEHAKSVEAEYHETISAYGYLLGGLIMLTFVYPVAASIWMWIKRRSFPRFWNMVSCVLFLGVGIISGHAFSNSMVFPVLSIIFITALNYDKSQNRRGVDNRP